MALYAMPDFMTVQINDQPRSAIRLFVSAWPTDMDNAISWEKLHSLALSKKD
jgi:hypothetical protein